nr:hypothetical protein [uncultured Carboxylicivirga sp.]
MNLLHMKVAVDTVTDNNETFELANCVGFTVINNGATDCTLHYQGGAALMTVKKGTAREFPGHSGYTYYGTMQIKFQGGAQGDVEVIKSIASTEES